MVAAEELEVDEGVLHVELGGGAGFAGIGIVGLGKDLDAVHDLAGQDHPQPAQIEVVLLCCVIEIGKVGLA